ncbi:MAG: T9SS type A sorting domain-containing protein [Calditrichia bacterium]
MKTKKDFLYLTLCFSLCLSLLSPNLDAQTFEEMPVDIPGFYGVDAAFGDYDNDGDMDLCVVGLAVIDAGERSLSIIYRNDDSVFVNINANILNVCSGSCDWGDYDNDGDLDLIITGFINDTQGITKIYRNDNDNFVDINAVLRPFNTGSARWGDYDCDGDLDILVCGASMPDGTFTYVYENVGYNTFNKKEIALPGISRGKADWIDYDNDSDPDIFLTGENQDGQSLSQLYENKDGGFFLAHEFTGFLDSFFGWGDYDLNGYADLFLAGSASGPVSELYRNDSDGFTKVPAIFENLRLGYATWGDFNNDELPDIFITGNGTQYVQRSNLYINTGQDFVKSDFMFQAVGAGAAPAADFDGDGDLDIFITGSGKSVLYRNTTLPDTVHNLHIPDSLWALVENNRVVLAWDSVQVDSGSYSYNVMVGTQPGLGDIVSPMASLTNGRRKVARPGNAGYARQKKIVNLSPGTYYWRVQSINAGYAGSPFCDAGEFTVFFDPNNQKPYVENAIPNQALVLGRDVFQRNLLSSPRIFNDPEGNDLQITALSEDTSKAKVLLDEYHLSVLPVDTGEVKIQVSAFDKFSGFVDTTFIIWIINLPEKTVFEEASSNLPTLIQSCIAWGDYDNDGDLDLAYSGSSDYTTRLVADIYRNDEGTFEALQTGIIGGNWGLCEWGDYDNDNDLDLLIAGFSDLGDTTILYRNDEGHFVNSGQNFMNVFGGAADWGDYDNDGDLDVVISGFAAGGPATKIYRNDSTSFVESGISLPGVDYGDVAWGDYDNDGDLDLLISGETMNGRIASLYINSDSSFVLSDNIFEPVSFSATSFGDYDNDGDLDVILSGRANAGPVTKIYNNDNGSFTDILAALQPVSGGNVVWGDYDNDGDFDVLMTGYSDRDSCFYAGIYENYKGSFVDIGVDFTGIEHGSIAWADYDNDGDLDFMITGMNFFYGPQTHIFKNGMDIANTAPQPPVDLSASWQENDLVFTWGDGSDKETERAALTYNLRIGTTPGGQEIKSAMSNPETGVLNQPKLGNVNHNKQWVIKDVPDGPVYWSIQSIDNNFCGSLFSREQEVVTGIETGNDKLIRDFCLYQNYPNPFNPTTTISYDVKQAARVELKIYDLGGRMIKSLVDSYQQPGQYSIHFDAASLSSGIYFYSIKIGSNFAEAKKMILLR